MATSRALSWDLNWASAFADWLSTVEVICAEAAMPWETCICWSRIGTCWMRARIVFTASSGLGSVAEMSRIGAAARVSGSTVNSAEAPLRRRASSVVASFRARPTASPTPLSPPRSM
jgi:hypothetical protein